ncbi:hypothetical protein JCM14244_16730 [Venenivibrio stagnispumantis]|uniref:hypothetical protein n=1 Tax=Venenivibrio stagnispumantis TaxID=407998 RepID=UPI00223669F5|nr:hypothetical protein [Venenivibrio stagnispumantis]MCW4573547.1 hypothetical protein [Venenivibrio stagnispumantis]
MDLKQVFKHRRKRRIILLVLLAISVFATIKVYREKVNEIYNYQIQKEMQEKSLRKINLKEV